MQTRPVHPHAIAVWRWQALIAALVITMPISIAVSRFGTAYGYGLLAGLIVLAVFCVLFLPGAHYRRLRFGLDATGIKIERGILWQSQIALPRIRVQHSDVSQGPLQRRYGVATLKLYTAGSRYTKIELPGLAHDEAIELRDALLAGGGESGV